MQNDSKSEKKNLYLRAYSLLSCWSASLLYFHFERLTEHGSMTTETKLWDCVHTRPVHLWLAHSFYIHVRLHLFETCWLETCSFETTFIWDHILLTLRWFYKFKCDSYLHFLWITFLRSTFHFFCCRFEVSQSESLSNLRWLTLHCECTRALKS